MVFLTPALLAGLGALAIPVIVHLIQRERKRIVEFPSLMFLRKIPYQSVRRRAIRHWPLLLLRLAAVALIALAFARPLVRGAGLAAGAAAGAREVVILLDHSYSMGYGDHWERARDAARRAVRSLGPDDRATLVQFGDDVQMGVRSTTEHAAILAAIDQAHVGAGATRYGPALKAAGGLLESSDRPRREIVLISDFQKAGWERAEDARLPDGVTLTPVPIETRDPANAAVTGVSLARESFAGGERVTPAAQIANHGPTRVADREVALEVDGRRLEAQRVSVGPHESAVATFAPFNLTSRQARVTIRAAADALPQDDVFRAVITPARPVPILILDSPGRSPEASLYLRRALAVGGSPGFDVRAMTVDQATAQDLAQAAVVVLDDARPPSGAMGRELERRVRAGMGLFVVLGERIAWPSDLDLLPGAPGPATDRSGTRGGMLGYVDLSHPVFEIFSAPRSGDLTAARVFRYRQLDARDGVIARFDDGAPALAERRVGQGAVLAWTSTLDTYWNDLALKPVFVPLVHQTMKHLARYVEERPWRTVGDTLDVAAAHGVRPGDRVPELVALTPEGRRVPLAAEPRAGVLPLDEQGFYEIRPARGSDVPAATVAVNVSAAESDLTALDPNELVGAVTGHAPTAGPAAAREMTAQEQERRQALWRYLFLGALALLVVETFVANRLPRVA